MITSASRSGTLRVFLIQPFRMVDGVLEPLPSLEEWPMCAVPTCKNRCCLSEDSVYCWPHTKADDSFDELMDKLADTAEIDG